MFFNPGRNGENIWVKDNILWREIHLIDEEIIGALTNPEFIICCLGLALFVEGHDNCRRAEVADFPRMSEKFFFPLFHRDRINNGLALYAFQTCLKHFPFGAIDHDGNPGNVRLPCHELQETCHGRSAVNQPVIHININDLRAAFNLLPRNRKSFLVIIIDDEFFESGRARDIGAFTNIDKLCSRRRHDLDRNLKGFETR